MAWRTHLFAVLRHPHEPRILVVRSDRVWRLQHVLVRERAGFATGRTLVAAFARRLGTKPWLLRQIRLIEDEAAELREVIYELEMLDRAWGALAAVVIPLHHAVSYQHIVAGLEPTAKPELDATHEFLREALARSRDWSFV